MSEKPVGAMLNYTNKVVKYFIDNSIGSDLHYDLTGIDGMTLKVIFRSVNEGERISAKEITKRMRVSKATVSSNLERLIKKGLIRMVGCNEDKRVKYIMLTSNGEKMHQQIDEEFVKLNAIIEKGLSEEEKTQIESLLKKIRMNVGNDE